MPGEAKSRLTKHHPVKPTHHPGQWEQGTDDKPGQGEHRSPGTKFLPTRNATVGVQLGGNSALGVLEPALQIMG